MSKHKVVRTPIDTVNIFGAGGIKQGTISEVYGVEKSGKSTFSYQTGGIFLKDNPTGVVHIIDVENSVDNIRLREVFKYDMSRVKIHYCRTLEQAFNVLNRLSNRLENQAIGKMKDGKKEHKLLTLEKLRALEDTAFYDYCETFKVPILDGSTRDSLINNLLLEGVVRGTPESDYMHPVFAIWDTIAVSKPEDEYNAAMAEERAVNAGGMGLRARIIELYACALLASIGGKPMTTFVLNQIRLTGIGSYLGASETSSGGNALKHNCHYRFKFTQQTKKDVREANYDEDLGGKTGTVSVVTLEKAKFCPITQDVEIYINDQLGGVIIPSEELAKVALKVGLITSKNMGQKGKRFLLEDDETLYTWDKNNKTEEDNYIVNNSRVRKLLMEKVTKHYRKSYFTMNLLYEDLGGATSEFGRPSEEEMKTQKTIDDQEILNDLLNDNPFI